MAKFPPLILHQTLSHVKEFANVKSEHDLRLKVKDAFFGEYDVDVEDERIDFLVYHERDGFFAETFLWAESKDKPSDTLEMFAQLLLTIKKKIDAGEMPPKYLGVFDKEKIAFTEFHNAHKIFNINDFNWNERPSSVSKETANKVAKYLKNIVEFRFDSNTAEIIEFIQTNFTLGKIGTTKAQINKNNFVTVYNKWVREVLPTIGLNDQDWKELKEKGVKDCDFYLADLLSKDNKTIIDKLNIVLQLTYYESRVQVADKLKHYYERIHFLDDGEAHAKFWTRYERPPKEEYHKHIIERRELLVPQDIRERKGAYFTPQIWVEKSQEYLAKVFGEDWQEEYYIWDCCAGTCNLLAGLTNKYNVWASTIDQPDVDIVHEIIDNHGLNLLKSHVFRFDFLNDEFDKLPKELREIINDEEKRKKLVIYMNPPYAEVSSKAPKGKVGVNLSQTHEKYTASIGTAGRELSALFLARIYAEIPGCKIGEFSKLKILNGSAFDRFRKFFIAKLKKCFIIPSHTFDNVKGQFPIGFKIWDTNIKKKFKQIKVDVFDTNNVALPKKTIATCNKDQFINKWISEVKTESKDSIGFMDGISGNDFQHNNIVYVLNSKEQLPNPRGIWIDKTNLFAVAIYYAVRHCMKTTWLNNSDQFLYPNGGCMLNEEFMTDCLVFTLLHERNRIRLRDGSNHWIPFTAREVNAMDNFKSTFMSDFLKNKRLSKEAKAVFEAGKALWRYYHKTIQTERKPLVDASLYEIREYFKGRDEKGRMKHKATDEKFNELDAALRLALRNLATNIQPKVYEYGFLKR